MTPPDGVVASMFARIDAMDVPGMLSFLDPDVVFQFGNNDPVVGRAAVGAVVSGVFGGLAGISHAFDGLWRLGDVSVCQLVTSYRLPDGRHVSLPAAVVLVHGHDDLVTDYRIYQDVSPLWAAP